MSDDFEIDLLNDKIDEPSDVQLPTNFLSFGEIEPDDVKVYIKQDVYKALEKYALEDTDHERGTIILGDYYESMGKTHIIISNYIEAKYTDASASTLTFTHETWDYVYKQQAKLYPDKKIVGWQHTHPNYGIFLSNYDLFIQENFFNLPFQVAYVIDPIQNIRGFFQWKNGKIEKLKGFYVYDDNEKPIKLEQTRVKKDDNTKTKSAKSSKLLIGLLCVAVALLLACTASLINKYNKQLKMQQIILSEINNQNVEITELKTKMEEETGTDIEFISYKVKPGDSLCDICKTHAVDYASNRRIILSVNGISDANQIYVGQTILLPKVK